MNERNIILTLACFISVALLLYLKTNNESYPQYKGASIVQKSETLIADLEKQRRADIEKAERIKQLEEKRSQLLARKDKLLLLLKSMEATSTSLRADEQRLLDSAQISTGPRDLLHELREIERLDADYRSSALVDSPVQLCDACSYNP